MLLGTLPATVTIMAIIRLRVCLCKGDASKLVTKRFTGSLYILEILWSVFLWALIQIPEFLREKNEILSNLLPNETNETSFLPLDDCYRYIHEIHSSVMVYKWANICVCYILPLVSGICIYVKIITHVYKSASRVQMHSIVPTQTTSVFLVPSSQSSSESNPSPRISNGYKTAGNIHRSVLGIVIGIIISWLPLCTIKMISLISGDYISILYRTKLHLILAIFVTFPFEEGILQSDKRKRLAVFFKRLLAKPDHTDVQRQVRHDIILIPETTQNGVTTILKSLQESRTPVPHEHGIVNLSDSKTSQLTMTSENLRRTSIQSYDSSSTSSLYSRRRGLMVPSMRISTSTLSENSSVYIISSPISMNQHSPYLSSNGSFSPLFIRVNREAIASTDSLDVSDTFTCTPYSVRTFSFGSTLSYDCQSSSESCRTSSFSRARSKYRTLQRKVSSSVKCNIPEY